MKTGIKNLILIAFMILSELMATGQENDFISKLKTQLLLYRIQQVNQIIILQTDKVLYRQGETIWMKGYVTDAITHSLSLKSRELSVQLADNRGVNVSEGKYLLKNGVADFNFIIPSDLPTDIYYLIAFTPETENVGIQAVFKKKIIIGRPEHLDIIPHIEYSKPSFNAERKESASVILKDFNGRMLSGKKFDYQIIHEDREVLSGKGKTGTSGAGELVFLTPPVQKGNALLISLDIPSGNDRLNLISKVPLESDKINISFFPEGGKLVPGIPQMIIYEVRDQLGNPVSITADITDEKGKFVTSTATIQPGLGVFNVINSDVGQMSLRITSEIGKNQVTQLPSPTPGSMSVSVKKNDGKNLSLLLGRSPESVTAKFKIVAVSNGEMIWASDFELEKAGILNVPLDRFTTEIASVGIFNENGALVAQRLVYTGKSQDFKITLTPDKSLYKQGEEGKFSVKIEGQEGKPVMAELAVCLSDRFAFPTSSSCVDNLNLGMEKPWPFKEPPDKVNRMAFDYYLASNSLTGFDWNKVIEIDPAKSLNVKSDGNRVSGKVVDGKSLPVPNALVNLSSPTLQQFNTRSDQHGEFLINVPVPVEKKELSVSATDEFGKGNYRVELNKSFKDELANSLNNIEVKDWHILNQLYEVNYFKNNPDFFRGGSSQKLKGSEKRPKEPYWKQYLNGSSNLLEILKTIRSYELIGGKIIFRGENSFLAQDGALIVLDGQKLGTDASILSNINPQDVDDINILLNPLDISRYTGFNSVGIIEIKTKQGGYDDNKAIEMEEKKAQTSLKHFTPKVIGSEKYNLITTLQWIPVLFTNDKGEATISFRTGGVKSTFVFQIAGFTDQGRWIGGQTEIRVE